MRWYLASILFLSLAILSGDVTSGEASDESRPKEHVRAGLLWWPVARTMERHHYSSRMERCLIRVLDRDVPALEVLADDAIRDMLYPLMESGTQPTSEEQFASLLQRDAVRERLKDHGLAYLIAFSATTSVGYSEGGIICGGGYQAAGCFGVSWAEEKTKVTAGLWNLANPVEPAREEAINAGDSAIVAIGLPIPIPASTEGDACRALGKRLAASILADQDNDHGSR